MSKLSQMLEFDPLDNPMYLKKVGNWVLTFLNADDQVNNIQLAITNVIPRKPDGSLQARRIIIEQLEHENLWQINHIECFDSSENKEVLIHAFEKTGSEMIEDLLQEFRKYDVEVIFRP